MVAVMKISAVSADIYGKNQNFSKGTKRNYKKQKNEQFKKESQNIFPEIINVEVRKMDLYV